MVYVKNVADFARINGSELKKMVESLAREYHYPHAEDIVQDVYVRMIRHNVLQRFNPNRGTKISSYLYKIADREILARVKKKSHLIQSNRLHMEYVDIQNHNEYGYLDDVAVALDGPYVDSRYADIIARNQVSDEVGGLPLELDSFEEYLREQNRTWKLFRRKNRKVPRVALSLLDVFRLLREGYCNKEIANRYGVSDMFITYIKNIILKRMRSFGFESGLERGFAW